MNILILTPSHPLCVTKVITEIGKIVKDEVSLTSINAVALLKESNDIENKVEYPWSYPVGLFTYATVLSKDKQLAKNMVKAKDNIFIGNLDRNTDIKFDHILGYEEDPWEITPDLYLQEGQKQYQEIFEKLNIPQVEWYTKDDVHHMFPTLHHLSVMLNVLGVVNHAIEHTVQSTPTAGD